YAACLDRLSSHHRGTLDISDSAHSVSPAAFRGLWKRFFFHDTATTEIYTLSLHDALPISLDLIRGGRRGSLSVVIAQAPGGSPRSEEQTSELQSHLNLVCRLLLEKKKKGNRTHPGRTANTDTWAQKTKARQQRQPQRTPRT